MEQTMSQEQTLQTMRGLVAAAEKTYEPWHVAPLLKAILAANDANHERVREVAGRQHLLQYLRDFRTIRLDIGQRTGKTTAICELARTTDVVVVRNQTEARNNFAYCTAKLVTVADLDNPNLTARLNPRTVWLDSASFTAVSHSYLYRIFGRDIDQRFVFLG